MEERDVVLPERLTDQCADAGTLPALAPYDAGFLSDYGGGNVSWWHDYIRAELGHAHDFYEAQMIASWPDSTWRPISEAKKNGVPILAIFRDDIYPGLRPGRPDLQQWNGVAAVIRHRGLARDGFDVGWAIAAPVGNGGFPDDWIAGWKPVCDGGEAVHEQVSQPIRDEK